MAARGFGSMANTLEVYSAEHSAPWMGPAHLAAPSETSLNESPPRAAAPRLETLDAARFIAIVGVVFVHTPESPILQRWVVAGTFGVPFYVFTALYLQVRGIHRNPQRSLLRYVWERIRQLYLPFLAWSVIYLVIRDAKHLLLTHEPPVALSPWMLISGTAHHLWFLPFLLFVCIVAAAINHVCQRSAVVRWAVVALSAVGGLLLATVERPDWLNYLDDYGDPYLFWWKALPSACWGIAVAWVLTLREDLWRRTAVPVIGGLLLVGTMALQVATGYTRIERTLGGLGLLLLATAPWRRVPFLLWMSWIGRRSYGIYLAHIVFIEGMQAVAHHLGFASSLALDVVTFASGLAGGLAVTVALQRTKRLAWLAA